MGTPSGSKGCLTEVTSRVRPEGKGEGLQGKRLEKSPGRHEWARGEVRWTERSRSHTRQDL